MSLWHLVKASRETLGISARALVAMRKGTFSPAEFDARLKNWANTILKQADMAVVVSGLENASPDETYVLMSYHQSLYDVPTIYHALPHRIRMVAKKELFRIPIWSHAMRRTGFVEVDRGNRDRAIESLKRASEALNSGTSIWIAPEGTRSKTGRLGPFKKGGFHMALDAGVRILPIAIRGTRDALPATGWRVRNGKTAHLTVCPPVDPAEFGRERLDDMMAAVRTAIERHLAD